MAVRPEPHHDLTDALSARPWPHNVAEVKQLAQDAATIAQHDVLTLADMSEPPVAASADEIPSLEDAKRAHVRRAIELCRGNQSLAARKLGITRNTLREYLAPDGEKT